MKTVINLISHPVTFADSCGGFPTVYPRPLESRGECMVRYADGGSIGGIPVKVRQKVIGPPIPDKQPGTYYIVTRDVADMFPDRRDLLIPDGEVVGDDGLVTHYRWATVNGQ